MSKNKPLCLSLEEATQELNQAIESISSKHGLPCYLLEYLVSDLLDSLRNGKRKELELAKKSYEQNCAERRENDEQCSDNS